ncbi:hypothetical protein [Arthrobacter tecti]
MAKKPELWGVHQGEVMPTMPHGWALIWDVTVEQIEALPRSSWPIVDGMHDIPPHWKARGRIRISEARDALGLIERMEHTDWPKVLDWLKVRQ